MDKICVGVLEDDDRERAHRTYLLEQEGFVVVEAATPRQLNLHLSEIDFVFSDLRINERNIDHFLTELSRREGKPIGITSNWIPRDKPDYAVFSIDKVFLDEKFGEICDEIRKACTKRAAD